MTPSLPVINLPCLTLQPLLENAVRHGIEPNAEAGWVRLSTHVSRSSLTLLIENSVGVHKSHHAGHGMALENIRRRLELMFGESAACTLAHSDGSFRVKLVIPLEAA